MRPIIGITLDWEEKGTFSKRPYYALRESYFDIIYKAGGLPLAIPYIHEATRHYLDKINALIVPGGDFALKKEWYVNPEEDKPYPPSKRLEFDIAIVTEALERNIPFLGICAGMQIMGGTSGAKMTPNVQKYLNTKINHRDNSPDQLAHDITVKAGSLLHKITGRENFRVNTAHTEAIVKVGGNLVTTATSEDGVIEAIERTDKDFALGVQWHPEFFLQEDSPSFQVFEALVRKAGGI